MGRKGREHAFCVHSNVLLAVVIVVVLMGGEVEGMVLEGGAIFAPSTEMLFLRWVHWVATLGHSVYAPANNLFSCKTTLVVDKRPGALADFYSIQDAIDAVAPFNSARVIIKVRKGVYKEKVWIPSTKPFITLEGEGSDVSIIKWGDTADKPGLDGNPMGTFNSATVAIDASYFIAKNITFRNSAPLASPGAKGKQAVALRISGDTAAFLGCKFIGSQDTLYDHHGRHYFKECYIEGSVDFVFGDGLSMYEGCHVHGIEKNGGGAVTAQKRGDRMEDSGFSFVHCRITGAASLYLGRAWGTFSRVVFSYTHMDNIVTPQGWYNWGDPQREQTVFFGQYKCYGPGASFAGRALWSHELTDSEAKPFLDLNFIDGYEWIQGI